MGVPTYGLASHVHIHLLLYFIAQMTLCVNITSRFTHARQQCFLESWALAPGPLPTCIETSNLSPERNLERMIWERWEEAARVIAKAGVETWTEEARATRVWGQSG